MDLTVQVGTIVVEEGNRMASALALPSQPYSGSWSMLKTRDSCALDREIHAAGWNFFFLAAEVKVMFFGALGAQKIHNALLRILKLVKPQNFNCLEVTGIVAKRFLGLSYGTVSAHSRHIQQSCQLDSLESRRNGQRDADWARG